MKPIIFRFSISLLTFAIGISLLWVTELFTAKVPFFEVARLILSDIYTQTTPNLNRKPRFRETGIGCGFWSSARDYETDDGQRLSEGFSGFESHQKAGAEFKKRILKSVRVINRVPGHKNHHGEIGERVVLINPPDERNRNETTSILWYDGGRSISFINSPSLDLALEFEQFLQETAYSGDSF